MTGDFTRWTFRPEKHYHSVGMQQGRVQMDADLNEQAGIAAGLDRITRVDVIGRCGFPAAAAGFGIGVTPDGRDLTLSPGRGYVSGRLCECRASPTRVEKFDEGHAVLQDVVMDGRQLVEGEWVELWGRDVNPHLIRVLDVNVQLRSIRFAPELQARELDTLKVSKIARARRIPSYLTQPYFPGVAPEALKGRRGTYLAYLDVWDRHVTAAEVESLREVGLDGEHGIRARGIWQVKLKLLADRDEPTRATLPPWETLIVGSTGSLRARTHADDTVADQGVGESPSGYRGFENQLYRVEVQEGGNDGDATFKWARETDSVVAPWVGIEGDKITSTASDRDGIVLFQPGQWVELTDDSHHLSGQPGTMVKVTKVDANILIVDTTTATGDVDIASFPVNPRVKGWGSFAGVLTVTSDEFIELEDGIEVAFGRGHYNSGDYWLIPARTATADVEWAHDSARNPLAKEKDGVTHHYCALALLRFKKRWEVVEDCRPLFSPLTGLRGRD